MRAPPHWREVAAGYDRAAAGYDDRHGEARSARRFRVIEAPLVRVARDARRVLELGCGTGRLLGQLDGAVGVDVSMAMLGQARARGLRVAAADAHCLPFADRSFDAVVAAKGLFRYLDYSRAFAECARVLAPGGALAVHQYAARTWSPRDLLGRRPGSPADHLHLRHPGELYRPARRAGLEPVRTHLWRSVRVPPYAVAVPPWLPGRLWSHCVVVFRRPGLSRTRRP